MLHNFGVKLNHLTVIIVVVFFSTIKSRGIRTTNFVVINNGKELSGSEVTFQVVAEQ